MTDSRARLQRLLKLNALMTHAAMTTSARRLLHGPQQMTWTWYFELFVELMNSGTPSDDAMTADDIRAALEVFDDMPLPSEVTISPALAGGVPGLWFDQPDAQRERVLLYLHGGGYVGGSPLTHRLLIAELGRVCRMRVLALDYRLAPEARFPAAVEDVWAAYWWLLDQGVTAESIAVGGDSAGGGLAMVLLLAIRDAGVPRPAAAFGLSPWLDLTLSGASMRTNAKSDYLNPKVLRRSAELYLDRHNIRDPLASPLFGDLHDLPPLLFQAGTAEMLFDDARRFARRATEAGVSVEFEPWENMVHVWHFLFRIEPVARHAIEHVGRFVREQTDPTFRALTKQ